MKNIALIFPGQGAQKVGMGQDLYEASPEAKAVFDKANEVLGLDLTKVIFEGPEEQLMATAFCQPAIFTTSMAALAAFQATEQSQDLAVKFTAGLSLGEYAAMCAAGAISFEDCLRLIQKRGALMEEATKAAPGKMAAVIGLDQDKVREIAQEVGCEVANFNAPDQIVITGTADTVDAAIPKLNEAGAKRVLPLDVSGAFHSSLMRPAADKFKDVVSGVAFSVGETKVITNVNARPQNTPDEIKENLPKQIYSSVQWIDSVKFIAGQGITDLVEIGPGRVLKGLVRKIGPELNVQNIQTMADLSSLTF